MNETSKYVREVFSLVLHARQSCEDTRERTESFDLLMNDSLKMKYGKDIFPLEYISWGVFKDFEYPSFLEFSQNKADSHKVWAHIHQNNRIISLLKDKAQFCKPAKEQLPSYTGKQYSPHLDMD
jgi:hypothetical protein